MKKHALLFLVFLLLTACGSKEGQEGLLVYIAYNEEGQRSSELIVADSSGTELRRIQLPELPWTLYPLKSNYRALAEMPFQEGFFLVDAQAGTAQELAFGESVLYYGNSEHFAIFYTSDESPDIYFANLDTAEITHLNSYYNFGDLPPMGVMPIFTFSPNDQYVALNLYPIRTAAWLIPAADLTQGRRLGGQSQEVRDVKFSNDSRQIAYSFLDSAGKWGIVLEEMDGTNPEQYLFGDDPIRLLGFAPNQSDEIVASRGEIGEAAETFLFDLNKNEEQQLVSDGPLVSMFSFPERGMFLLRFLSVTDGTVTYYLVDGRSAELKRLDSISGYEFGNCSSNPNAKWLYFSDTFAGSPTGSSRLVSLDLETGETHEIMERPEAGIGLLFSLSRNTSWDCRLQMFTIERSQLWLFDASTAEARLLAEGGVMSAISPDNQWIALGEQKTDNDTRHFELSLIPVDEGEAKSLGLGFSPIWVLP